MYIHVLCTLYLNWAVADSLDFCGYHDIDELSKRVRIINRDCTILELIVLFGLVIMLVLKYFWGYWGRCWERDWGGNGEASKPGRSAVQLV